MFETNYSNTSTDSWTPPAVDHDESQSSVEHWSSAIKSAWAKTVGSVVEVGNLISQAKEELGASFRELEGRLPFNSSTAAYFIKIAEHPVLSNQDYWPKLPSSYNTLYALSALNEAQLIAFIGSGRVTPETTLGAAKALTGKGAQKKSSITSSEAMRNVILSISESADFAKFIEEIKQLAEQYQANLDHPMNKDSIGWWNHQKQLAAVEAKIEETQWQLQGVTLEQLRMLERAVGALPKSKKDGPSSPPLSEDYAEFDQLADLLGTREITKKALQTWCKDKHIPSRLALADVEHEVYIWEQVRLIGIQDDAKGALKRLHAISEKSHQAEIKQLVRTTALNMVDAFEV